MTTVYIDRNSTQAQRDAAEYVIEDAVLYNPEWSGASICMEYADNTYIDTNDEIAGTALLQNINRAIDEA